MWEGRSLDQLMMRNLSLPLFLSALSMFLACTGGCSSSPDDQRARDERTRNTVAKAAERARPAIEEAGRKIDEAAHEAARDVRAAAEGARDGWKNAPHALVDVNHASETELAMLPGISRIEARKIIAGRPYARKNDLLSKGVISESDYDKIRERVTAK
jgi:competence protein ComEA